MELSWRSDRNHSVELVPAIREVMSWRRVKMADLDAVFVARGPGGFSALRVGMSTAKTMADALDVPLVSVPTLDIEARPYLGLGRRVCAVMPAGRERVYFADYGPRGGGRAARVPGLSIRGLGRTADGRGDDMWRGCERAGVGLGRASGKRGPGRGRAASDPQGGRAGRYGPSETEGRSDRRPRHVAADLPPGLTDRGRQQGQVPPQSGYGFVTTTVGTGSKSLSQEVPSPRRGRGLG